jgi:ADP-heptose:LPS heptosyltransferase
MVNSQKLTKLMWLHSLYNRAHQGITSRLNTLRFRRNRILGQMGPFWFINLRWPWPVRKPFQRKALRLLAPGGGLGDALMCPPIFREIKRRNPRCHITFVTYFTDLFQNSPYLDGVEHYSKENERNAVRLEYLHLTPPPRPSISIMAECVGLRFFVNQLEAIQPPVDSEFARRISVIPRPLIVLQTRASDWTPNKDWPASYWQELAARLTQQFDVIEVGKKSAIRADDLDPRFHSYVGRTSVAELIHIISQADVFVGPPSGGMHIANASRIPSVIIYGGYEAPTGYRYDRSVDFYSPVDCAPCWLITACPYALKCMTTITPEQVFDAICRQLKSRSTEPGAK